MVNFIAKLTPMGQLLTRMRKENERQNAMDDLLARMIGFNDNMNTLAGLFAECEAVVSQQAELKARAAQSETQLLEELRNENIQHPATNTINLAKYLAALKESPVEDNELHQFAIASVQDSFKDSPKITGPQGFKERMAVKRQQALEAELAAGEIDSAIFAGDDSLAEITTIYEKPVAPIVQSTIKEILSGVQESFALNVVLNERQLMAKEMALSGKNYVLIGPAGSGKTTAQRAVAETLLESRSLSESRFKIAVEGGGRTYINAPSIAFVAYTRRAASNLAKAIHKSPALKEGLRHNVMTIHALLEFEPEMYWDAATQKEKFRFAPKRTAQNPLDITHLVIEEASMLGLDLWEALYDALPAGVQIIFIGDINQLPPVFGPSILNYALVQLPIIELIETYRNQGIVLENAHRILAGREIVENEDFVIIRGKGKVQVGQSKMALAMGNMFKQLHDRVGTDGRLEYDPEDCIILSPWNKNDLGTNNLNKWIAQFLGEKRHAVVHEVIAGFNKLYLAVGDRVMFNKRDAKIITITRNSQYFGREPQLAGSDLSRFGVRIIGAAHGDDPEELFSSFNYDNFSLDALENDKAERKQQASHVIIIQYDDESKDEISAAGDLSDATFSLGYALTVHKAQGSEWRKVFLILHKDFAVSLYRELFYTAVTRARTKVTVVALDHVIAQAIRSQRIKGDTLKDKLEYFNGGADLRPGVFTSKH